MSTATTPVVPPPQAATSARPATTPMPQVGGGREGQGKAVRRLVHTGAEPRLAALSVVRAAMVAVAGFAAAVDPALDAAGRTRLGAVVAAWAVMLVVVEVTRRADIAVTAIARMAYLMDGVLLVLATVAAGGSSSPLFFLAFIHVIAVTLLASYLTGLKAAIWDSLLLLVAAAAQTAGAIPHLAAGDGSQAAAAVIRALALLGVTAVTAASSALNERELRRSRAGLETMLATGQALMATRSSEEAIQIALTALTGPLEFATAACVVERPSGPPLVGRRHAGAGSVPVTADRDVQPRALHDPVLRADPAMLGDPLLPELLDRRANAVAVPLRGSEVGGVLAASLGGRPRRRGLPIRTLELIQSLSDQLVQTLERIWLAEAIAEAAASDGLTGVPNRRHFDERFSSMLQSAATTGQPLAVLAIDIDHFKPVNDVHGHQVGDEVLKVVAATLRESKRADDVLARYGGEEFAMLLPATDMLHAIPLAERLRRAVADADSPVAVTVSVGVASTLESGMSEAPLFAAADQALYRAKHDGRNCVRTATG